VADVVVSTLYAMKEKLMEYQYRYQVRNPPRAVLFADPGIALLFAMRLCIKLLRTATARSI
jgi:hypothetical protein